MQEKIQVIQNNLNNKVEKIQLVQIEIDKIDQNIQSTVQAVDKNLTPQERMKFKAFLHDAQRHVSAARQSTESLRIIIRILCEYFDGINEHTNMTKNDATQLLQLIKKTNNQMNELMQTLESLQNSVSIVEQIKLLAV